MLAYVVSSVAPLRAMYTSGIEAEAFYSINAKTATAFVLIYYLVSLIVNKNRSSYKNLVLLFPIWILLSNLWAIKREYYILDLVFICLVYMIAPTFFKDEYDIKLMLVSYIFAGLIYVVKILPMTFESGSVYDLSGEIDRNYASLFLVMTILCSFVLIMKYGKHHIFYSVIAWIEIILSSVMIFDFASRTAAVILLFVLLYYIAISVNKKILNF